MKLRTLFNALGACLALSIPLSAVLGSSGCGSTACIQWNASKGACPSPAEASASFLAACTDIQSVNGQGVAGDNLCCYPVTKASNGIACNDVGSSAEGPVPPNESSSVSTGPIPACDFMGFCGESFSGCAGCAANGPCLDLFTQCLNLPGCDAVRSCIDACAPGNGDCKGTCLTANPTGVELYGIFATCVFCNNCPSDCSLNTDLCSFQMTTGVTTSTTGPTTTTGTGGAGGMMTGTGGAGGMMTGTGGAGGTAGAGG